MTIQHILITTDLSPESLRAYAPIAELARSLGSRITLLHVVQDLRLIPRGAPTAPMLHDPALPARIDGARAALEEQRAMFGDMDVEVAVIPGSDVPASIAEFAKEHGVDLIAISTHGRTGFRRLVLGSVAEALLRHTSVPVLVFPRADDNG